MSHVPSQISAAALNLLLELNAELQAGLNLLGRRFYAEGRKRGSKEAQAHRNRKMRRPKVLAKCILLRAFQSLGCYGCGRRDGVIEGHHAGQKPKSFEVSEYSRNAMSLGRFFRELVKCVPLCPQCHSQEDGDRKVSLEERVKEFEALTKVKLSWSSK